MKVTTQGRKTHIKRTRKPIAIMTKLTEEEIKKRLRVICICKGIRQARISDAIATGCETIARVNQKTGSGSGGCKGKRCGPVITQMLQGKDPSPHPDSITLTTQDNDEDCFF